jgi:phosphoacetylglucosamine mutase
MIKKQLTEQVHIDAINNLITYLKLGNHTVGDALANVLLVEAALFINDMRIEDVDAFYEDVVSYQEKVPFLDRSKYICNKTEERLIEPSFIQQFIDTTVTKGERAFVRASGTESIVRIYTEGATLERAVKISKMIREKIEEIKS